MVRKEKLHLPDLSTMMFYFCCFGSHADGGNEEPPDRRQASVDSRQSRSGQGKPECCSASVTRFSFVRLLYIHFVFFIRLCHLTEFCNHRYYPHSCSFTNTLKPDVFVWFEGVEATSRGVPVEGTASPLSRRRDGGWGWRCRNSSARTSANQRATGTG